MRKAAGLIPAVRKPVTRRCDCADANRKARRQTRRGFAAAALRREAWVNTERRPVHRPALRKPGRIGVIASAGLTLRLRRSFIGRNCERACQRMIRRAGRGVEECSHVRCCEVNYGGIHESAARAAIVGERRAARGWVECDYVRALVRRRRQKNTGVEFRSVIHRDP